MSVARQAKVAKRAKPLLWLKGISEKLNNFIEYMLKHKRSFIETFS